MRKARDEKTQLAEPHCAHPPPIPSKYLHLRCCLLRLRDEQNRGRERERERKEGGNDCE